MSINLHLPENIILKPCITVFGVGGAGGNAVNNMITANLEGAKFVVANTDAQALEFSKAEHRIQLGETITRGLGAGASPDIGRAAAEEAIEEILEHLNGSNMVFITAGMGGGTGTGAAPVIAKAAREQGILTVGVVTKPFHFEGAHRMRLAESGLAEMHKHVDTLIIIPNQNLFRIANEKTTFADAFKLADDVLHSGVRGVTDLMTMPGLINLDFADVRSVMKEMGKAMMGTGEAEGENRATIAAESAISNPLLDHSSMKGARGVLINITGGADMTLFEVDEAANRIREEVDPDANIIFGSAFNQDLDGKIRVSVVATGIEDPSNSLNYNKGQENKSVVNNQVKVENKNNLYSAPQDYRSEFYKRNIPTYSNNIEKREKAEFKNNLPETNLSYTNIVNDEIEEQDYFVSPQPIEPKTMPNQAPSNFIKEENSILKIKEERNKIKNETRKDPVIEENSRAFNLFSKFLAGKDKKDERKDFAKEKVLVSEEFDDVPAFERRKK